MKVPKEKHKVNIFCLDGSFVTGFVHVPEGLRVLDYMNEQKEQFLIVTEARFQNIREVRSFQLIAELQKKRGVVFLNKTSIKWVEEID